MSDARMASSASHDFISTVGASVRLDTQAMNDTAESLRPITALYGAPKIHWGTPVKQGKLTTTASRCGFYKLFEDIGPRGMLYSAVYTPKDGNRAAERFWVERDRTVALQKLQEFHESRHRTQQRETV